LIKVIIKKISGVNSGEECTLVIHPFIIGYPFRLRALRRALEHISMFRDEIWVKTPGAVASHFAKINPAP
jgi:hypothetical protein